ncbi:hypothetical protein CORC01_05993 [Colletotrichum orchidophilum]|uniref:Uncharacterized protein n=1 Tax=Colletotrichum orchidophilum TaxID=1209926 RepID=A0A1G4BBE6_9PEZI|nr:uncharacterized protein CORC01_05993 [Colletotrichum orchidophilum]OHE98727.1 hypothetical protein CORC01_05993 [Colletotrichum orchidophilum]
MGAQYPVGSSASECAMWFACLLYCAVLCIASHHAVHGWAGLGRLATNGGHWVLDLTQSRCIRRSVEQRRATIG